MVMVVLGRTTAAILLPSYPPFHPTPSCNMTATIAATVLPTGSPAKAEPLGAAVTPLDPIDLLYTHFDALDLDKALPMLDEQAVLIFGNNPPARGHDAIRAALEGFWTVIRSMQHETVNRYERGEDTVVLEALVHYTTKAGNAFSFPAVTIVERAVRTGLVTALRIYIDLGPMLASIVS